MKPFVSLLLIIILFLIFKIKANKTIGFYIYISIWYLIISILYGNKIIEIFLDFICITPLILLIADDNNFFGSFIDNDLAGLKKLLPYLLIVSLFIFFYMDYKIGFSEEVRFSYNSESKLVLFAPITPIFMIPYMLCYSNVKYNFFLYIGALFILYMGISTQTKSVFIPIAIPFILKIIFNNSVKSKIKVMFFVVIIIWILYFIFFKYFPDLLNLIIGKFDSDDASNLERINESITYLKKCDTFQLLFGKGFGGLKTFYGESYIGGESMLHIGPIHLIMKGGIFLLSLIYFPLILIIIKDSINKNYQYVLMVIIFIVMDFSHTQWQSFTSVLVYWLLVYYRFYKKNQL